MGVLHDRTKKRRYEKNLKGWCKGKRCLCNSAIEYYIFNVLLMCLLISEIFIFFYTRSKQNRTEKIDTRDLGTKWLLYLNFVFCLIISFLCISQKAPFCIRELTLPAYFAKIGMLIIAVGICIRIKAVLTLKRHLH